MRCKPGDLAVIVSATNPENRNRIVEVLDKHCMQQDYFCWLVRCSTPLAVMTFEGRGTKQHWREAYVPDAWMRPIRDPGEDAQDEALQWLPAPEREGVTA